MLNTGRLHGDTLDLCKVQPLRRALAGKRAWITGQRREHSAARRELPLREFDALQDVRAGRWWWERSTSAEPIYSSLISR